MRRQAYFVLAPVIAALAFGSAGCGPKKPVATVARAEMAIDHATQSQAAAYAPSELAMAQDKLWEARRAMDRNRNEDARRLASEAMVHAQLAEAKARSESARVAAEQTRRSIDALAREASGTTVVVEKRTSPVVVERSHAPSLVIESRPRPDVIIEKPATTAVIVEKPVEPDVIIESR
jgi:hypothetical protein